MSDKDLTVVIDPPTGWAYGFPKAFTLQEIEEKGLLGILQDAKYPPQDIELALRHMRMWGPGLEVYLEKDTNE